MKVFEIISESRVLLPPSFRVCGTCSRWAGDRKANMSRTLSDLDISSTGECVGGGFNFAKVSAQASCSQWQLWPVLKK